MTVGCSRTCGLTRRTRRNDEFLRRTTSKKDDFVELQKYRRDNSISRILHCDSLPMLIIEGYVEGKMYRGWNIYGKFSPTWD